MTPSPPAAQPLNEPPIRLVAFDMDGTLVDTISSWAAIHRHFHDSNEEALRAFMEDRIDDEEFVRRDLALWRKHKPDIALRDLEEILSTVPLMPGARELVQGLHDRGIVTAIVSGGLDTLAARLQRELGFPYIFANGFFTDGQGVLLRGNIRVPVKQKETTVRALQARLGIPPEATAAVGNSEIDVGMFRASRIRVAFAPDDDIVRAHATHVVEGRDLREVLPILLGSGRDAPR
jgi:phosphoserine phosphatase